MRQAPASQSDAEGGDIFSRPGLEGEEPARGLGLAGRDARDPEEREEAHGNKGEVDGGQDRVPGGCKGGGLGKRRKG